MKNATSAPNSLRTTLAIAMTTRRAQLGWSQRHLAKLAGVRGAYIGGVEAGSINVSLTNFERIRSALWPSTIGLSVKNFLASRLLEARAKVSQERLAELAHVSISLIVAIEGGRSNTSLDQIEALAIALDTDPAIWLGLDPTSLRENAQASDTAQGGAPKLPLRQMVAEDLRKLRQFYAMNQSQLAEKLGHTKGHISQIENAKANFSLVTVERYVNAVMGKTEEPEASYALQLGNELRQKRRDLKLNQEQVAALSGLTESFIGRLERGSAAASMDQLEKLTTALELDGHELLAKLYPRVVPDCSVVR